MAGSEVLVLLACLLAAGRLWFVWLREAAGVATLRSAPGLRGALLAAPFACCALLFTVLLLWASFDVRDSALYLVFYVAMGAAWVALAMLAVPYLGISARDDVIERHNRAALWPVLGAMLGITLCFAGGNVGDGPGWWVVVFCGLLSTGALFGLWWLVESLVAPSDAVTVDRDPASGVRLGAFLASAGLVLGRSVAGDWHSAGETIADFVAAGWPAAAIAFLAIGFQRAWRPTAGQPARGELVGLVPALLLLATAVAWVANLGGFE